VTQDRQELIDSMGDLPIPTPPAVPVWFWPVILLLLCAACGVGWLVSGHSPYLWGLVPFTFVGNSLAMIPYDWYLPGFVQYHDPWLGVGLATAATVLIEFWNMDVLARLLARDGTRAFRGHRITARLLGWYRRAPWWTLVIAGFIPVIPFYPCRLLATLAQYSLWRYQSAVIVGRSIRYLALAELGMALSIPPSAYLLVGLGVFCVMLLKLWQQRARRTPA
jgi:uncharacterized membrane protein YdjX (TVP38/TMEM64 family)